MTMTINDRVALLPHLDLWARGARYGNVVRIGVKVHRDLRSNEIVSEPYVIVKVDGVPRVRKFLPSDLEVVQ